jgi:hypothetical protein
VGTAVERQVLRRMVEQVLNLTWELQQAVVLLDMVDTVNGGYAATIELRSLHLEEQRKLRLVWSVELWGFGALSQERSQVTTSRCSLSTLHMDWTVH